MDSSIVVDFDNDVHLALLQKVDLAEIVVPEGFYNS